MKTFVVGIALFISLCSFTFCNGEVLKTYESQTRILVQTSLTKNKRLVTCSKNDDGIINTVLVQIKDKFRIIYDPNPSIVKVFFEKKKCDRSMVLYFRLVFDEYYLSRELIYLGKKNMAKVLQQFWEAIPAQEYVYHEPRVAEITYGYPSMPVEFQGDLKVDYSEMSTYTYCTKAECIRTENKICDEMYNQVVANSPKLKPLFKGCHVTHFLNSGKKIITAFALKFDYYKGEETGAFASAEEVRSLVSEALKGKQFTIMENVKVTGVHSIDTYEFWATSPTTIVFTKDLHNAFSGAYLWYSKEIKRRLIENLARGSIVYPTCLVDATQVNFDTCGKYATVGIRLIYSKKCFAKHKILSATDAAKSLKASWETGNKLNFYSLAPQFFFFNLTRFSDHW